MARLNLFALFALLALTSCSHLFLYPDHHDYFADAAEHILHDEGFIPTPDGEQLNYWYLPAQIDRQKTPHPKGLVIVVHGNGQNLSAHVRGSGWLTAAGYNLAIFDYRGYGKSTGSRDLNGAFADTSTALDYLTHKLNQEHLPVFFYGQSLGGTLLLKAVSSQRRRWSPSMIIIESAFYSYVGIAREKLADHWLTWPFQWLAYLCLSDRLALKGEELRELTPIPVEMFYSERDQLVPIHHGEAIFHDLAEPKQLHRIAEPGHINAMWVEQGRWRDTLVQAMAATVTAQPGH